MFSKPSTDEILANVSLLAGPAHAAIYGLTSSSPTSCAYTIRCILLHIAAFYVSAAASIEMTMPSPKSLLPAGPTMRSVHSFRSSLEHAARRSVATIATFQVPAVNNEPNVGDGLHRMYMRESCSFYS